MTMQFQTVVVSLEDPRVPRELREATRLVAPGGRIHALLTTDDSSAAALAAGQDALRKAAASALEGTKASLHVRIGGRADEVLRLAVEANADLMILGAYQPNSARVVAKVMSWAACSVLVLAPNTETSEGEGFVPLFPQCTECASVRRSGAALWYCALHQEPGRHVYEALDGK